MIVYRINFLANMKTLYQTTKMKFWKLKMTTIGWTPADTIHDIPIYTYFTYTLQVIFTIHLRWLNLKSFS